MKKFRGWLILAAFIALCGGAVWLTLRVTAEYPTLGEPVSYPVNQVEGFELTIEEPVWSPFRGYTIRWRVAADSDEVYHFIHESENPGFEFLERQIDGQWYRLGYSQEYFSINSADYELGGNTTGFEGSIVQKYAYYGTRLEPGKYRAVLEMRAEDQTPRYLAAEFDVA